MDNNENNNNDINLSLEEIQAIVAERDLYKTKATEAESGLKNVVEELKQVRQEKNDLKLKSSQSSNINVDDIKDTVMRLLEEKENEKKLAGRQNLFTEFLKENKEFSPDNDVSGLKREALRKKFERFNIPANASEDEVREALKDAASLVTGTRLESTTANPVDINLNPNAGNTYTPTSKSNLTSEEKLALQRLGWDEKKFLDLKQKHPAMFESLL